MSSPNQSAVPSTGAGSEPVSSPDRNPNDDALITKLMQNPTLTDPVRTPRNPIALCHGLYGFDVLGPSAYPRLQLHYWQNVNSILKKKIGAELIITSVPSVGSIESRAQKLHETLTTQAKGRRVNFMAHSMGGLDCRHLITHVQPNEPVYEPLSLTTVCSPHRGSPFMDWCRANLGIGDLREAVKRDIPLPYTLKQPLLSRLPHNSSSSAEDKAANLASRFSALPASLTTLILGMVDAPAYSDLTTSYCDDHFNPATPAREGVKYFSVGARQDKMSVFHPLWLPKIIVDESEAAERKALSSSNIPSTREWGNDGLVTLESARYGEWLGYVEGCNHWDARGAGGFGKAWEDGQRGWSQFFGSRDEPKVDPPSPIVATPDSAGKIEDKAHQERQSSLDRSAAALEWIASKVPAQAAVSALSSLQSSLSSLSDPTTGTPSTPRKKTPKFDLELFYIALARNLYDHGL